MSEEWAGRMVGGVLFMIILSVWVVLDGGGRDLPWRPRGGGFPCFGLRTPYDIGLPYRV